MKRPIQRLGALSLALSLLWGLALPASAAEAQHDMAADDLVLTAATCSGICQGHLVTGSANGKTIQITGGIHTVILDGVTLESADEKSPISVTGGAQVDLELRGTNVLTADRCAGLLVEGASVSLGGSGALETLSRDESDHGMDDHFQGCGIFLDRGELTVTGGTLTAKAEGRQGAGIGGREMKLTISGGTVNAQGATYGPGIGGPPVNTWGNWKIGRVEITGGRVNATASHAAGIGSGDIAMDMDLIITGGTVSAEGLWGLGGRIDPPGSMPPALYHGNVNIYIDGVDLTAKGSGERGCGIQGSTVQITGGATVEAVQGIRALELGIFDSAVTAPGGPISCFSPFDMVESDREAELQGIWAEDPIGHINIVNSTVETEGVLASNKLGRGVLDLWDSTVTAGGIGAYRQSLDAAVQVNIHSGQVRSVSESYGILGDVNIYGGAVYAEGTRGPGIGGPTVTIFDGDVEARGGDAGAGIGGGAGMKAGVVSICGGTVTATGGAEAQNFSGDSIPLLAYSGGAGIGGGGKGGKNPGNVVAIYGGTVVARGGVPNYAPPDNDPHDAAGIGGGFEGDSGKIYITGGTVTAYGSHAAAGIGAGSVAKSDEIVITGGTVTVYGGDQAAAIGGGWASHKLEYGRAGNIYITGGTVKAVGDTYGAGIGNGMAGLAGGDSPARIVITGGDVTAQGGPYSSGIGGSGGGDFGVLRSSDADPDMEGDFADIRKGFGGTDGGEIIIGGDAQVTATGAPGAWGIGGGIPFQPENGFRPGDAPKLTILEGAQVNATLQGGYTTSGTIPEIPAIPPQPVAVEGEKPTPAPIPTVAESPFQDVSTMAWYYGAVCYAVDQGLFKGVSADRFDPAGSMDRSMLVTVLHRAKGAPAPKGTASFQDVPAGAWYTDAVLWAAEEGVVSGTGGNSFTPQRPITRQELAVVLYNDAGKPTIDSQSRSNLSIHSGSYFLPDWAKDALAWMVEQDLWVYQEKDLLAAQPASRSEVAAVMQAYLTMGETA